MNVKSGDDHPSDRPADENRSSPSTGCSGRPRYDGGADGGPILVPVVGGDSSQAFTYAVALADATGRELVFLGPESTSTRTSDPQEGGDEVDVAAAHAARARSVSNGDVSATGLVRSENSVTAAVRSAATNLDARTVVVEEPPANGVLSGLRPSACERISANVDADIDVVRTNGRGSLDGVRSILVPVAGGPHSGLAVDAARALATATGAWIDLLHVFTADATADERDAGRTVLAEASDRLSSFDQVDTWSIEAEADTDVAEVLVRQAPYYDAVVMGEPTKGRLRRFVSGSTTEAVNGNVQIPVVVVADNTSRSWSERTVLADAQGI